MSNIEGFVLCIYCKGFFNARSLYKHTKVCFVRLKENSRNIDQKGLGMLKASRAMLDTAVCSDRFKEIYRVLAKMKRNHENLIIKTDPTLLLCGTITLQKKEEERYADIRYSLRCMARLIIQTRKNPGQENVNGNDLVRPQNYDVILEATKALSIYKSPRDISKPSVFLKIGFCLKNLALYLRCVALRECNQKNIEEIRNFLELCECDWQIYGGNARGTYESRNQTLATD